MSSKISPRAIFAVLISAALAACVPSAPPIAQAPPPERVQTVPPPPPNVVQQEIKSQPVVDPSRDRPNPALAAEIAQLWRSFPGRTGISVQRVDGNWVLSQRGDEYFPQQSVSKLWVTMTVLDKVDNGEISLNDTVTIRPENLTLFHQPLAARVARNGAVRETVASLIEQAITHSDNSANDALLWHAGGPEAVRAFIAKNDLGAIRFGPGERLLQSGIAGIEWRQELSEGRRFQAARAQLSYDARKSALDRYLADPIDGASPEAITDALARLARGELLSVDSTRLLLDTLSRTQSGPNRLKAGVPAGWKFGHKTGTGQDLPPISTGYNDVGIMTAPDGTRYTVAVMLGDTTASIPERMALMQAVARAVARYHRQ